jgi:hypothetical protein
MTARAILAALAADPNLSPAFAAAIRPFPVAPERLAYEQALRRFDWSFEFSDDGAVVRRGRAALAELREQQQRLDPRGAIWRAVAPSGHGVPQPIVRSAA